MLDTAVVHWLCPGPHLHADPIFSVPNSQWVHQEIPCDLVLFLALHSILTLASRMATFLLLSPHLVSGGTDGGVVSRDVISSRLGK